MLILLLPTAAHAAPSIELELATEPGLQITAPREWLQLFTSIGVKNVRIRGARRGDAPAVANRGSEEQPRYHVLGILTARQQLRLPGGTFGRGDAARLRDYFDRLAADGEKRLTAPRGLFGLTETELTVVFTDLSQPINFETKGLSPRAVLDKLAAKLKQPLAFDVAADRALRQAAPVADELKGISAGTALAMMLRPSGLVLRPEKPRGQPVTYRITQAGGEVASATGALGAGPPTQSDPRTAPSDRPGKMDDDDMQHWPIGWDPEKPPGAIAPSLFERLNAEIDGFTLDETLEAVRPRLKVPFYLDHAALAAHQIDPAAVDIRIDRARMTLWRLLSRVLSQARLGMDLRADEAGTVFLWITR